MFQNNSDERISVKETLKKINQHFVGDSYIRNIFEKILKNCYTWEQFIKDILERSFLQAAEFKPLSQV